MAFEWHSKKAARNLKDHGVSFDEAATIFDDPFQVHYPDDAHSFGEQRYICLGFSNQGRLLMLAYTEPVPDTFHIITAREVTRREQREYESQRNLT